MSLRELSERHESLLRELSEERVAALTRISRILESLIEQLQAIRARIEGMTAELSLAETREYERVRARAKQYRWFLDVQREAMGLRPCAWLDDFYAVPGPLTPRNR